RMLWLYRDDVEAMRRDIDGSCHTDEDVREAIRRVYQSRGYLLDPHSAIAYLGLTRHLRRDGEIGIFLATAHPAKFAEIVEPIIGRAIERPGPLADAVARPRHIMKLNASLDAVGEALVG